MSFMGLIGKPRFIKLVFTIVLLVVAAELVCLFTNYMGYFIMVLAEVILL